MHGARNGGPGRPSRARRAGGASGGVGFRPDGADAPFRARRARARIRRSNGQMAKSPARNTGASAGQGGRPRRGRIRSPPGPKASLGGATIFAPEIALFQSFARRGGRSGPTRVRGVSGPRQIASFPSGDGGSEGGPSVSHRSHRSPRALRLLSLPPSTSLPHPARSHVSVAVGCWVRVEVEPAATFQDRNLRGEEGGREGGRVGGRGRGVERERERE